MPSLPFMIFSHLGVIKMPGLDRLVRKCGGLPTAATTATKGPIGTN